MSPAEDRKQSGLRLVNLIGADRSCQVRIRRERFGKEGLGLTVTGEPLPGVVDGLNPHESVLGLIDNFLDERKNHTKKSRDIR